MLIPTHMLSYYLRNITITIDADTTITIDANIFQMITLK